MRSSEDDEATAGREASALSAAELDLGYQRLAEQMTEDEKAEDRAITESRRARAKRDR